MKTILDACCGSRMFWFDRQNENTVYMDNRIVSDVLCDGRKLIINPDVLADFRDMPYRDNLFNLVVFDPPHLIQVGEKSWLAKKYGKLSKDTWKQDLSAGFTECMRVLKPNGVLIFKWCEEQIKLKQILDLIPFSPLFGDQRGKTRWIVFMKG